MPRSEYDKERYIWLKEHHICVNCGNEDADYKSTLCFKCKEKIYKRNNDYYLKNKQKIDDRKREYRRKQYHIRKENGICTKCGKRKVCRKSTTLCIDCYIRQKRRKDKRWNNDIDRDDRVGLGLCYICGKKLNKHNVLCDKCLENSIMKMKKINDNPTDKMLEAREKAKNYLKIIFYNQKKTS